MIQNFKFCRSIRKSRVTKCVIFNDLNRRLELIEVVFLLALFLYFDNFRKNPIYTLSEKKRSSP